MRLVKTCLAALGVALLVGLTACGPDAATTSPPTAVTPSAGSTAPSGVVTGMFPCSQAPQVFGKFGLKPDVSKLHGYCSGAGGGDAGFIFANYLAGNYLCAVVPTEGKPIEQIILPFVQTRWNLSPIKPDSLKQEEKMDGGIIPISFKPFAQMRHVALTKALPDEKAVICYKYSSLIEGDDIDALMAVMKAIGGF